MKKAAVVIALALPAVLAFVFIARYGVNVVFWDQWDLVPLWEKLHSGSLNFSDLTAQHNEHRFLLIRIITLLLGSITHWNNVAEMYFSWGLICLTCFVLYKIYTLNTGSSWQAAARFIPVTWLMFNLYQFENLLHGIQIVFFLTLVFFLLSVYLLQMDRGMDWRFFAALLCAAAGSYSTCNGLTIWITGLFQLVCLQLANKDGNNKVYIREIIVWTATAAAVFLLYFWDYRQPYGTLSLSYFIQQPFSVVAFALAALGSQFGFNIAGIAILAGALLVILYTLAAVIILKDLKSRSHLLPYLVMILFTAGFVAMLVIGRIDSPLLRALTSRYVTFTLTGITGLYIIAISLPLKFFKVNFKFVFYRIAVPLLLLFLLCLDLYALMVPGQTYLRRQAAQQYLMTYRTQSDENLKKLYPESSRVREYAPILEKYRLNVFFHPE